MRFLLPFAVTLLAAGPAFAGNEAVGRVIQGYIIPAYAEMHAAAGTIRSDLEALCVEPTPAGLAAVQKDFRVLAGAWSEVELIRFGPVTEENRLERILFWPDRKSIGLKQVQAALADRDPTANDPQTLAGKSVAMQGLGALEFVLFGTGFEALERPGDPYRCEYGRAIATNVEGMVAEVQTGWLDPNGIAAAWANPAPGNALYRTDEEAMTELLDVLVHGLEMVRDVRINGFLGETADGDKPKQALFWRSGATFLSVAGNLRGARRLFHATDFPQLLPADAAWIAQSADFEFNNADRALAGLTGPPAEMLADSAKRQAVAYLRLVTSSLSDIIGSKLASALGLTAGFSSLDGD